MRQVILQHPYEREYWTGMDYSSNLRDAMIFDTLEEACQERTRVHQIMNPYADIAYAAFSCIYPTEVTDWLLKNNACPEALDFFDGWCETLEEAWVACPVDSDDAWVSWLLEKLKIEHDIYEAEASLKVKYHNEVMAKIAELKKG